MTKRCATRKSKTINKKWQRLERLSIKNGGLPFQFELSICEGKVHIK